MAKGSNRSRANAAAQRAGGRFIGASTAAGVGRLRRRSGGLTTMVNRARSNRSRAARRLAGRPGPRVR